MEEGILEVQIVVGMVVVTDYSIIMQFRITIVN